MAAVDLELRGKTDKRLSWGFNSVKTSRYYSTMHVCTWLVGCRTNHVPTDWRRSDVLHTTRTYGHLTFIPLDRKRKPRNAQQMKSNWPWHSAKSSTSQTTLQSVYNDMFINGTLVQMLVVSY